MSLRVAVQMDPLEHINISGDSTFAIMLGAQARGHELYYYLAEDLTYRDGRLYAGVHAVSVQPVAGDHFRLGEFSILDLGKDVDVVLMRQDPPFDLGYITATHLLERGAEVDPRDSIYNGTPIGWAAHGDKMEMVERLSRHLTVEAYTIHVTDLVRAHMAALRHLRAGGDSEVFNCGYSKGFSVLQVIEAVKRSVLTALRRTTSLRRRSPIAWPSVSFTSLKLSMSR